jgi:16S rRNA (guanine527-N7)-methyltransferase
MMELADSRVTHFVELFARWNEKINLSAARTPDEILEHVEDSLAIVPFLANCSRVLDVGSGGGFPVVLAALALPQVSFTSLEPVHKKHAFLRTAVRELQLTNLRCLSERLETHTDADYDAAVSRATFDLDVCLEMGVKRVVHHGIVCGFEAIRREDLSGAIERHSYTIRGKSRSIVIRRRA